MRFYLKTWFITFLVIGTTILFFVVLFLSDLSTELELLTAQKEVEEIKEQEQAEQFFGFSQNGPTKGNERALLKVVFFSDFACPFCKEVADILNRVQDKYKNAIYLQYRHFPISDKQYNAKKAAKASMCADEQDQFWPFHELLFENQYQFNDESLFNLAAILELDQELFVKCMDSNEYDILIEKDLADGLFRGIAATPTFIINGKQVQGAIPFEAWEELIKESQ